MCVCNLLQDVFSECLVSFLQRASDCDLSWIVDCLMMMHYVNMLFTFEGDEIMFMYAELPSYGWEDETLLCRHIPGSRR